MNHRIEWLKQNRSKVDVDFALPKIEFFSDSRDDSSLTPPEFAGGPDAPEQAAALKNLTLPVLDLLQRGCLASETPPWVYIWADKLLRGCELNRRQLQTRIVNTGESTNILQTKALRMCLFFLSFFSVSNDARYVNIVLKIVDMRWLRYSSSTPKNCPKITIDKLLEVMISVVLDLALIRISSPTWHTDIVGPMNDRILDKLFLPMCRQFVTPPNVVIFSPNPFGLVTLLVCELLKIHGIEVRGIVVRRLFNFDRLIMEIKRDGLRWVLRKIVYKLIFRGGESQHSSFQSISHLQKDLNAPDQNVYAWARENKADLITCDELNDPIVHNYLRKSVPDMVVFCGGGLITESTIRLSGVGVLNCHGGVLPRYRGLDVVEWALLENHPDLVGMTTHFMNRYVDEGDVLMVRRIDVVGLKDVNTINSAFEAEHVRFIVHSIIKYFHNGVLPIPQNGNDGKQYFYMHPRLLEIINGTRLRAINQ